MRTVIADDEPLALNKLRRMLESEPGVQIVQECSSGGETIAAVATHKPNLLLLDISMPDMDGFQVLASISRRDAPVVIFTTAYAQHAVRAFEAQALDYLLKPFDRERLHQAIARAQTELLRPPAAEATHLLLDLISKSAGRPPHSDHRFVIKAGGRIVFLDFDEITWVEAAANYIRVNTGKESYLLREGIGKVAERLDATQFVRIHRSLIVNVKQIKELQPVNSGEYIVVLKDGKELSCSRGFRAGLQNLIHQAF
jgi:two-component system, LytTR family, response regulator